MIMARAGILFGLAAVAAFVGSLLLGNLLSIVAFILAFGSMIALGWGAGRTAAKVTGAGPGQGVGRGAGAGAISGGIQLIGLTVALLLLANIPAVRSQIDLALQQAAQQDPNVAGSGLTGGAVSNVLGITSGLLCGGINFVLMLIGGLIGGAMWKGTPDRGEYVAASGSGSVGGGFGTTNSPYDTTGTTGTASTYDTTGTTGTGFGTTGTTGTTGTASTYDTSTTTGTEYGATGTGYGTTGTTGDQGDAEGGVRVYDTDDRNRS